MTKDIAEMTDAEFDRHLACVKSFIPVWKQDGCTIQSEADEMFIDRNGNQATIKYVYWKDKKGKEHKSVSYVRWEND